jgi:hypothetical protein
MNLKYFMALADAGGKNAAAPTEGPTPALPKREGDPPWEHGRHSYGPTPTLPEREGDPGGYFDLPGVSPHLAAQPRRG